MNISKSIVVVAIVVFITAALSFARPAPPTTAVPLPKAKPTTTAAAKDNPLVDFEADVISKRGANDSTVYLVGNVKFHHNGAIIECDSAARYDQNRMDFFGKVIINKDSAYVYGDKVSYDGRTSMAEVYAPLVKMLRGDVTMYSYNLQFNTKTNIATFIGGGLMNQKDNFMEAYRGEYNADLNIVKFLDSVAMRSDSYVIKTDSLNYNLDAEQATFLARSTVWDKDSSILIADLGYYFNQRKTYEFKDNAYLLTKDQEIWADTMLYFSTARQATMFSNVQVLDTTQRTIALSDWAFYDDSVGTAILTRMPSVRSYDEAKKDTTYTRADTIIMLTFPPGGTPRDSEDQEEQDEIPEQPTIDTTQTATDSTTLLPITDSLQPITDSLQPITDSLANISDSLPPAQDSLQKPILDSLPTPIMDSLGMPILDSLAQQPIIDSLQKPILDSLGMPVLDSLGNPTFDSLTTPTIDSLQKPILDSLGMPVLDSLGNPTYTIDSTGQKIIKKTPEKERVLRAYHNVRSWAKDYQGICDSLVGFSVDSTATLYGNPILWSDNNQVRANRINIYSANEQIDWIDLIGDPFITQQLAPIWPEPADTARFNQAVGRSMQAYFRNNELDSATVNGNVINYYYMESDGYTAAFAILTCSDMVIFFQKREPWRMRWENNVDYTIFPIDKIPADQPQRLQGFSWQDALRPKSAKEISDRILRESIRTSVEGLVKPPFTIEQQINDYKKVILESGQWSDRTDQTTVTPEYFEQQNMML